MWLEKLARCAQSQPFINSYVTFPVEQKRENIPINRESSLRPSGPKKFGQIAKLYNNAMLYMAARALRADEAHSI